MAWGRSGLMVRVSVEAVRKGGLAVLHVLSRASVDRWSRIGAGVGPSQDCRRRGSDALWLLGGLRKKPANARCLRLLCQPLRLGIRNCPGNNRVGRGAGIEDRSAEIAG